MSEGLIYSFPWKDFPRELYPRVIREFLDWGVNRLVFTDFLAKQCLLEPEWIGFLHGLEKTYGVHFLSMHGVCGRGYDMDTLESFRARREMISDHIRCMDSTTRF